MRLCTFLALVILIWEGGAFGNERPLPSQQFCPRYPLNEGKNASCRLLNQNGNITFYQITDSNFPDGSSPVMLPAFQDVISRPSDLSVISDGALKQLRSYFTDVTFEGFSKTQVNIIFDNLSTAEYYSNSPNKLNRAFQAYDRSKNQSWIFIDINYLTLDVLKPILMHELQHVFQDLTDYHEHAWVDEGLSLFMEAGAGGDVKPYIKVFSENPITPMRAIWDYTDGTELFSQYGQSYLFMNYVFEKYGIKAIQEIARNPLQGEDGVMDSLSRIANVSIFKDILADFYIDLFVKKLVYVESGKILALEKNQAVFLNIPASTRQMAFVQPRSGETGGNVDFIVLQTNTTGKINIYPELHLEHSNKDDAGMFGYLLPEAAGGERTLLIINTDNEYINMEVQFDQL